MTPEQERVARWELHSYPGHTYPCVLCDVYTPADMADAHRQNRADAAWERLCASVRAEQEPGDTEAGERV